MRTDLCCVVYDTTVVRSDMHTHTHTHACAVRKVECWSRFSFVCVCLGLTFCVFCVFSSGLEAVQVTPLRRNLASSP